MNRAELRENLPAQLLSDFDKMCNFIDGIKKNKHIPPHVIEFEGNKIRLYDAIVKILINDKNDKRTLFDKIRNVEWNVHNIMNDVKTSIGLNALSNLVVLRKVNRGKNEIRIVYVGSFMQYADTSGEITTMASRENDVVFYVD